MKTHLMGIPSTARKFADHLIPSISSKLPPLIEQMAASHAAVLAKWNNNFALNLRRPVAVLL